MEYQLSYFLLMCFCSERDVSSNGRCNLRAAEAGGKAEAKRGPENKKTEGTLNQISSSVIFRSLMLLHFAWDVFFKWNSKNSCLVSVVSFRVNISGNIILILMGLQLNPVVQLIVINTHTLLPYLLFWWWSFNRYKCH